jgi:biopolymer transport protein ExbB/TolQ
LSLAGLKSPFLWGGLASGVFYTLVHVGVLDYEFVRQYFAGHPVEYVATTLFFIGLAVLAIKLVEVSLQSQAIDEPLFPGNQCGKDVNDQCQALIGQLDRLPRRRQHEYLVRRLRDALDFVRRTRSTDAVEDELRYLADLDSHRAHASYGLVRMIIWAIPILGFLGTVIGIALAIGKLSPQALEDSLPEVMAGLTVAFNTTALALGLSMALMFALFLTERKENWLLAQVDRQAEAALSGRFSSRSGAPTGELGTVRAMLENVIHSTERLVERQCELWERTIQLAQERWSKSATEAGSQLKKSLGGAIAESLKVHAKEVAVHEQLFAERNRQHWSEVQQELAANTKALADMRQIASKEAEILGRVVGATDHVAKLEQTLNRNLAALAGSKNFEETVMSLAAAIHLLNSRLSEVPGTSHVQLEDRRTGHAA